MKFLYLYNFLKTTNIVEKAVFIHKESMKKIRISNKGYTDLKGKTGDLYLEIVINNPKNLSGEKLELYKKLILQLLIFLA